MSSPRTNLEQELLWREAVWAEMQAHPQWPDLPPMFLREKGIYGGAAGIWRDANNTGSIIPSGLAVSVLHTGKHYADDLDEDGIIYHYPTTDRPAAHDATEIQSVKNVGELKIPIFVISRSKNGRRVERGWVSDHDDKHRLFLIEFSEVSKTGLVVEIDQSTFEIDGRRKMREDQISRAERSPRFKFDAIKRFGGTCAVTGIDVVDMLDGAHVVPVKNGGPDDPRNALLLSASHHRAYDAHLWVVEPGTLKIVTRPDGPTLERMKFKVDSMDHLAGNGVLPHVDALERRFELFEKSLKKAS
jgi:putative restriction endonuclease